MLLPGPVDIWNQQNDNQAITEAALSTTLRPRCWVATLRLIVVRCKRMRRNSFPFFVTTLSPAISVPILISLLTGFLEQHR